jgi:HK97 family phage portal protein
MAKARAKPRTIKPTEASVEYSLAYTRPQDTSGARFTVAGRADLLLPRINQWLEIAAHDNAQTCAGVPMRLYRSAKASGRGKQWGGVKVDKARTAYLKGDTGEYPSLKAIAWATQGEDIEEVVDGDLLAFLRRPNPWMSGRDWTYLRFKSKETVGNSFAWVATDGPELEAYFLPPQGVRVVASMDEPVSAYRYSRMGDRYLDIAPEQVQHGKFRPSMLDWRIGESWTHGLIQAADVLQAAVDAQLAHWRNGARPDWLLTLPQGASVETQKSIKAQIQNEHRGPQKRGGFMVAPEGTNVHTLGYAPKDRGYEAEMDYYRRMIDVAAGRPESRSKMNDANRASAQAGETQYARQTILPRLSNDAEELTEFLLPLFGLTPGEYWLAYDNPVAEDTQARTDRVQKLTSYGVMTINEARALEGLDPVDAAIGDVLRYNGQPLAVEVEEEEADDAETEPGENEAGEEAEQEDDIDPTEEATKRATKAIHDLTHKAGCGCCTIKEYDGEAIDPAFGEIAEDFEDAVAAWIIANSENASIGIDGTVNVDESGLGDTLSAYIIAAVGVSLFGVLFGKVNYAKRDADAAAEEIDKAVARYRSSPMNEADKEAMRRSVAASIKQHCEQGNVGNVIAKLDGDAKEVARGVAADVYQWAESDGSGSAAPVIQASYGKLLSLAALGALIAEQARRARGLGGAANRYARRVASGMANTQRTLITSAVVAAQAGGVPLDAALMSARSSAAESASYRSVAVARTEIAATDNYTNIWAYSAGGRVEGVEWVLSAVPCQACILLAIDTAQANGSMDPVAAAGFRQQAEAIGPGYNDNTKPQLAALGASIMASGANFTVPLGRAFGQPGQAFGNIDVDDDAAARHMAWLQAAGMADGRQAGTFEYGIHAPPLHPNCNCSIRPVFRA